MMRFRSTRGLAPQLDLRGIALAGLAADGGLYVPVAWPHFDAAAIAAMRGQPYQEIAFRVLQPFVAGVIPDADLRRLIDNAYTPFDDPAIAPLHYLDANLAVLELFHGPSLAFKDFALQFLGQVFEYFLADGDHGLTVIGATSGDTGSAAIAALARRRNIDLFILYPTQGPSEIQRRQMTCVDAPNVQAVGIDGSFDDCQAIIKAISADTELRAGWRLTTVNSINLLRILAQIVYYFAAAAAVAPRVPHFAVPTGNFGDAFAGYAAWRCGLPMGRLIVASNGNDILTRFFASGRMEPRGVTRTLSPSMDIQVSSNFERLLFDLCDQDAAQLRARMQDMAQHGSFTVPWQDQADIAGLFRAASVDDAQTIDEIRHIYQAFGYVADPHTAVGLAAARRLARDESELTIVLGTAAPAKFPETVKQSIGLEIKPPERIETLIRKPERTKIVANDVAAVVAFIKERKSHERSDFNSRQRTADRDG